jgi:hypothetical protein
MFATCSTLEECDGTGVSAACQNYELYELGSKVCSSSSMCVDQNVAYFDNCQCDYEGFTCNSNVTECVEAHGIWLRKHNDLVDEFNNKLKISNKLKKRLYIIEICLMYIISLKNVKSCVWLQSKQITLAQALL